MTTTYCTAQDVANYLRLIDTSTGLRLNVDSIPSTFDLSKAEIETLINLAEDYIDRNCDHSWRAVTATAELHECRDPAFFNVYSRDVPVHLNRYPIKTLDHSQGDKVEVWQVVQWIDLLDPANKFTQGLAPSDAFWVDEATGCIHLTAQRPSADKGTVRVTYRSGETVVPSNIRKATILLTGADILDNDRFRVIAPEGATLTYGAKGQQLRDQAEEMLATYHFHLGV